MADINYEKEHIKQLRKLLAECTLFLKKNEDFPLDNPCKVALFGSGARKTIKGGTGSGDVNSRYSTSVEQGLNEAGFTITSTKWLDDYDKLIIEKKKEFVKEVKRRAKANHTLAVFEALGANMPEPEYELALKGSGDVAVYVLGRISGEGTDRGDQAGDVRLTDTEIRDILALNERYKKFMLVLNVGGAVDLSPVEAVDNILVLSQLGVETGAALADILLGKANPSGKLTTTWTKWEDYQTIGSFGDMDDTEYKEGIYVGYRYFDSVGKKPMFPFGFGLSYTEFEITSFITSIHDDYLIVTADVYNVGKYAGKEVIQLYVSIPEGELDQPYQSLCGFAKTKNLMPGEGGKVQIIVKLSELASYSRERESYILEAGDYVFRIGNSSDNTKLACVVNIAKTIETVKVKNIFEKDFIEDYKPERKINNSEYDSDITIYNFSGDEFIKKVVDYSDNDKIEDEIEGFTTDELIYFNIGAFNTKGTGLSIVGNAASKVAGAAGETISMFEDRGLPGLVMSDGPAGVRISPKYYEDKSGAHPVGSALPGDMGDYLPKIVSIGSNALNKMKMHGAEIKEHYATAIPIGTAIAQSFNVKLAAECGDIVGDELEAFGIQLWLAPALNIHRSIRCGRNFEYYSEDPLVSGLMAAAITDGVHKHKNTTTTIKHFACNNQETNRYNNNSVVSERALRDIYLKGFEICVKKAKPKALMSSYNLINGRHSSEMRELSVDVLRKEWGYEGLVMTDWIIRFMNNKNSKHPGPDPAKIAAAGEELVMPGCKEDYLDIKNAIENGTLDLRQLKINASRLLRVARELSK